MKAFLTAVIMVALPVVPALGIDEPTVYLMADQDDRYVPVVDDGGDVLTLADINSITAPSVSPEGDQVAFAGSVGDESLGGYAIFVVDSDGTDLEQLTSGSFGEFDPSWSPDGSKIAFAQNINASILSVDCCRLSTVDVSTGVVTGLTGSIGVARPSFSAQGSFIVYDTPTGLWKISSNGGTPSLIAPKGRDGTSSPEGDQLAYLIDIPGGAQLNIVAATGGLPTRLHSTVNVLENPFWVGDRIFFLEYSGAGYDGRTGISLRSVSDSGGLVKTEQTFVSRVVGVSTGVADRPSFTAGDIDLDGNADVAKIGPANRTALLSTGSDFAAGAWDLLLPRTGWNTHLGGDFNGDSQHDTASYLGADGTWHVAIAGAGSYSTSLWADFSTASGWGSQLVGDFDGDGDDDIANFHPSNGTWWVSRSSGSSFSTSLWADFSTASGWGSQLVGDFDGDGDDDIANFHPSNGTWWVSRSSGSSFSTSLWADFTNPSGWDPQLVGDFDGDGTDDIANYHSDGETWWVSVSTGGAFATSLWEP